MPSLLLSYFAICELTSSVFFSAVQRKLTFNELSSFTHARGFVTETLSIYQRVPKMASESFSPTLELVKIPSGKRSRSLNENVGLFSHDLEEKIG